MRGAAAVATLVAAVAVGRVVGVDEATVVGHGVSGARKRR